MDDIELIDLTQTLETGMPVFPGTENPRLEELASIRVEGYRETRLHITTHVGTHIDCPAHLFTEGFTTEDAPCGNFYGPAMVIDCKGIEDKTLIEKDFLEDFKGQLTLVEFVLFYTGWAQHWGRVGYFNDFPTLTTEAAQYLSKFKLKGIGFDTISADPVKSVDLPVHKILLGKQIIIIENLVNLDKLTGRKFHFACFPLKVKSGDGSPVRAVGMV